MSKIYCNVLYLNITVNSAVLPSPYHLQWYGTWYGVRILNLPFFLLFDLKTTSRLRLQKLFLIDIYSIKHPSKNYIN